MTLPTLGMMVPIDILTDKTIRSAFKLVFAAKIANPDLTPPEIRDLCGLSDSTVFRALAEFKRHSRSVSQSKVADSGNSGGSGHSKMTQRNDEEIDEHATETVSARGTRLNPDWKPCAALHQWADAQGFSPSDIDGQLERFIDYWVAKPGGAGRKTDWSRTFRNWLRRSREFSASSGRRRESHIWGNL